ncbi:MAG: DMT family transporter [Planctomycetota bacterium]|nr:DMT family transporter [Planctomycetota bacterium]
MLSPAERSQFLPQLLLLLMIAIWGASFSATKVALDAGIPALALIAIRFWIAVICLLPILNRTRPYLGLGSSWLKGAATGLALLFGYWFQTHGMKETTSSVGGFMTGLIVLIVAVGARVLFNERMSRKYITGLLTGCVGLLVLCYGATANETGKNSLSGILLQVGSSSCFAAHVLLVSRFSPRGNEIAFCWWQLTAVAIGATIAATAAGFDLQDLIAATPNTWLAIGYLGLLATALGITVQSTMQPRVPPSRVAILLATQPAFAVIAGVIIMGDSLGALEWVGGTIIAASVLIANRR